MKPVSAALRMAGVEHTGTALAGHFMDVALGFRALEGPTLWHLIGAVDGTVPCIVYEIVNVSFFIDANRLFVSIFEWICRPRFLSS